MYLTVCFLIEINKIQTASSDISLRKNNVNLYGFGEIYMDKQPIEGKVYQVIGQFNERKIIPLKFYSILLNKIHPL